MRKIDRRQNRDNLRLYGLYIWMTLDELKDWVYLFLICLIGELLGK